MNNWITFIVVFLILHAALYTSTRLLQLSNKLSDKFLIIDKTIAIILIILSLIILISEFFSISINTKNTNEKFTSEQLQQQVLMNKVSGNLKFNNKSCVFDSDYVTKAQQVDIPSYENDSIEANPSSIGPGRINNSHLFT